MTLVYYISPVGADGEYQRKRAVLASLASVRGVEFLFPLERSDEFSVGAALEDIRRCEFVIADLSLERPSCYFEVGLAQAIARHVVLVAAEGTVVHQAGGTEQIMTYRDLDSYRAVIAHALDHMRAHDA